MSVRHEFWVNIFISAHKAVVPKTLSGSGVVSTALERLGCGTLAAITAAVLVVIRIESHRLSARLPCPSSLQGESVLITVVSCYFRCYRLTGRNNSERNVCTYVISTRALSSPLSTLSCRCVPHYD